MCCICYHAPICLPSCVSAPHLFETVGRDGLVRVSACCRCFACCLHACSVRPSLRTVYFRYTRGTQANMHGKRRMKGALDRRCWRAQGELISSDSGAELTQLDSLQHFHTRCSANRCIRTCFAVQKCASCSPPSALPRARKFEAHRLCHSRARLLRCPSSARVAVCSASALVL